MNMDEAARAFAALKLAPRLVEAWVSLGHCRYRDGANAVRSSCCG